jgi:hypothetical protein
MNDSCHSIELSSASMPLLLEETVLDESMNRLINQVAVRTGGSHGLIRLDSTWLNLDHLSRRRLRFEKLGRLQRLLVSVLFSLKKELTPITLNLVMSPELAGQAVVGTDIARIFCRGAASYRGNGGLSAASGLQTIIIETGCLKSQNRGVTSCQPSINQENSHGRNQATLYRRRRLRRPPASQ